MKSLWEKGTLRIIIINIIIAIIIVMSLFIFLFSPYKIIGNSMSPVLKNGEKILISNLLLNGEISRFDIVVIIPPDEDRKKIIKRIVGLPGENIEMINGNIYIDSTLTKEPFLEHKGDVIFKYLNMKKYRIPLNSYFLLGDYRERSSDSRNFGSVAKDRIIGKILFRYWPLNRFGVIE